MIVCPLCEHPQDRGDTCEVCGKRLSFAPPTSAEYPPLPELEATTLAGAEADVAVALMPDLEITHHAPVAVPVESLPEFETTRLAGATGAVAVEPVPGVEPTLFAGDGQPTVLGETTTCRYCGQAQKRANRLCERCANALPTLALEAPPAKQVGNVRCPSCGFESSPSQMCPACGYFLRPPD